MYTRRAQSSSWNILSSFRPAAGGSSRISNESEQNGGDTVVFFARDITDRRLAEEALARTEERYRLAARATNDALWDWDIVADTMTWNVAITTLLGYDTSLTSAAWWLEHIHPDEREGITESVDAALMSQATSWSGRYRFCRGDGTYGDFVDRGFIIRDASDNAVRMIGSMTDVTQITRLQAQLLHADRLAALGTLAGGVGHEINNPLAAVMGNLEASIEMLEDTSTEREDASEMLRDALAGARRIAEIVKSLRVFTRHDSSELRQIDVGAILDAAIRMADSHLRHRANLIVELEQLPSLHASDSQLAQVFLNLLINAAQAVATDDKAHHVIRVQSTVDDNGWVSIAISDRAVALPRITSLACSTRSSRRSRWAPAPVSGCRSATGSSSSMVVGSKW